MIFWTLKTAENNLVEKDINKYANNDFAYGLLFDEEFGANMVLKGNTLTRNLKEKSIILEGEDDEFSIRKPSINKECIK